MDALPTTFPPSGAADEANELAWLLRAEQAGLPVTPMVIVPAAVETSFYALNNLAEQLRRRFEGLVSDDPDEDDLEDVAPEAVALVRSHVLLDEVIERLYDGLEALPEALIVRRVGTPGTVTSRGRGALLTLKRLWAAEWEADAVAARLRAGEGLAPSARAVVMHDARVARVRHTLDLGPGGASLEAWHDREGRLARLAVRAAGA